MGRRNPNIMARWPSPPRPLLLPRPGRATCKKCLLPSGSRRVWQRPQPVRPPAIGQQSAKSNEDTAAISHRQQGWPCSPPPACPRGRSQRMKGTSWGARAPTVFVTNAAGIVTSLVPSPLIENWPVGWSTFAIPHHRPKPSVITWCQERRV